MHIIAFVDINLIPSHVSDKDDCSANGGRGPCDQQCVETVGGYECLCNIAGYALYLTDGFMGFFSSLLGEDPFQEGATYHIDHTCVRKYIDKGSQVLVC